MGNPQMNSLRCADVWLALAAVSGIEPLVLRGCLACFGGGEWDRTTDLRVMSPSL